MKLVRSGWMALGALLVPVLASAAVSDCDSDEFATVLAPAADAHAGAATAHAYWLDRARLQWPGASAGGRFKLYGSQSAALRAAAGAPVAGADAALALEVDAAPLPAALAERFKFIGAGPRLALAAADAVRVPVLLKGQVLLVREDEAGRVLESTNVQLPGALDALYADAAERVADLGATPSRRSSAFKLWAPTAQRVHLCRYANGQGTALAEEAMSLDAASGVWSLRRPGDLSGQYYRYLVDVVVPGVGRVRNRVTDPYSVSLTTDSLRSYVADLASPALKPPGWDATPRPARVRSATDMVIYELHVRDFSIADATVRPAWRGKYLAFAEPRSNGMAHLRALSAAGMTDIHLLPVFDLATVPESGCRTPAVPAAAADGEAQQAAVMAVAAEDCFNWGYDPLHYSAPEGSYATDPADGAARIREFRRMVQALHRANLRVGMDVVYNHTSAAGQHKHAVLDRIVPGYYQRLDAKGAVERSTCCDNTATEHRMMAKLMVDSVRLWARAYKIDSFRFDLMAHQPRAVMERLQRVVDAAAGRPVQLIGEGWNFGEVAHGARFVQASQLSLNGSGIATFSDRGRDAARGGSAGDSGAAMFERKGWLDGTSPDPRQADLIRVGLAGSLRNYAMPTANGVNGAMRRLADIAYGDQPAGYVAQPGEVVNYVENHDNQTLFDMLALKLPRDTSREGRARAQLLAASLTALSQGVAYFHAGIDVLRSKSLDRNSYDSGDWFNRLDWSYRDNGFGAGLPPQTDNGRDWALLAPVLADPAIKPGRAEIAWMRDAFRDLLKIRASTTLLRLPTAAEIERRLTFPLAGPAQDPSLIVGRIEGSGLAGGRFKALLYVLNAAPHGQAFELPAEAGAAWRLHPVQRAAAAADRRVAREARFAAGRFAVPARSVAVFVID